MNEADKKRIEEMANSYPSYYELTYMNSDTPRLSGAEYLIHGYKRGATYEHQHMSERIARLEKALWVCKDERNSLLNILDDRDIEEAIASYDKELDEILKGE